MQTNRLTRSFQAVLAFLTVALSPALLAADEVAEAAVEAALGLEKVKKAVEGMKIVKKIVVKNRIVNLIVKPL